MSFYVLCFPLFEVASMSVGSCVAILSCSSEVTLVVTHLPFSQVNPISCFAVQRPWDLDVWFCLLLADADVLSFVLDIGGIKARYSSGFPPAGFPHNTLSVKKKSAESD